MRQTDSKSILHFFRIKNVLIQKINNRNYRKEVNRMKEETASAVLRHKPYFKSSRALHGKGASFVLKGNELSRESSLPF